MEDLSDLHPELFRDRGVIKLLASATGGAALGGHLADAYVRLVAKAVAEHQAARQSLQAFENSGEYRDLAQEHAHLETCIQSLHRALRLLERMRRDGHRTADGRALIPRGRDLPVVSAPIRQRIQELRDATEHLEDHLVDGSLPGAGTTAPYFDQQSASVVFGPHRVGAGELASWLRQAYGVAAAFSDVGAPLRAFLDADSPESSPEV